MLVSIKDLPDDILKLILDKLSFEDIRNVRLMNKEWQKKIDETPYEKIPKLIGLSISGLHQVYLYDDGSVFTGGSNKNGQLGHGDHQDRLFPTQINKAFFKGKKVVGAEAGQSFTVFLCEDGSIFLSGDPTCVGVRVCFYEYMILASKQFYVDVFQEARVVKVVAASFNIVFLCENGSVFTCGAKMHELLGSHYVPRPIDSKYFENSPIVDIAISKHNMIFLCENGKVFIFGSPESSLLTSNNIEEPCVGPICFDDKVFLGKKVIKVSTDEHLTSFYCEDGSVFMHGESAFRHFGMEYEENGLPKLFNCKALTMGGQKIIEAINEVGQTLLLCQDGNVFKGEAKQESHVISKCNFDNIGRGRIVGMKGRFRDSLFFYWNDREAFYLESETCPHTWVSRWLGPKLVNIIYNQLHEAISLRRQLLSYVRFLKEKDLKLGTEVESILQAKQCYPVIPGALLKILKLLNPTVSMEIQKHLTNSVENPSLSSKVKFGSGELVNKYLFDYSCSGGAKEPKPFTLLFEAMKQEICLIKDEAERPKKSESNLFPGLRHRRPFKTDY